MRNQMGTQSDYRTALKVLLEEAADTESPLNDAVTASMLTLGMIMGENPITSETIDWVASANALMCLQEGDYSQYKQKLEVFAVKHGGTPEEVAAKAAENAAMLYKELTYKQALIVLKKGR